LEAQSPERSYEFLEAVTSDLSFVARGATLEEAFAAAADALLAATVADPASVRASRELRLRFEEDDLELLLLRFLAELVYRRDAEGLLLRVGRLELGTGKPARLEALLVGESIDPPRHRLETEVKAVTAHGLRVAPGAQGWEVSVTLDV
jgi:SHS2 domain-containing protein